MTKKIRSYSKKSRKNSFFMQKGCAHNKTKKCMMFKKHGLHCDCTMCKKHSKRCHCSSCKKHGSHYDCPVCKKKGMYGGGCGCSSWKKGGKSMSLEKMKARARSASASRSRYITGGGCGSCHKIGGGSGDPISIPSPSAPSTVTKLPPVPVPLVGEPWTVNNTSGNYFSDNQYPTDVQLNTMSSGTQNDLTNSNLQGLSNNISTQANPAYSPVGGQRKRRGGGIIPQDLVNFGNSFRYGLGSAFNAMQGLPQTPNPLPYMDQMPNTPTAGQLRY